MVNIGAKFQISASNHKEYHIYYMAKHTKAWTRRAHLIGTAVGVIGVAASAARVDAVGAAVSAVVGVVVCWAGDILVEQTQPTSFSRPIWSVMSNFKMVTAMLKGDLSI
ncbi:hypothetical protein NESM_000863700 [Novymonas esmeraldas]|uniref:Uncharacterized protein n=1 Tax=Novymonas esmeraldas TaxID=1808958 RepID=A0AAW0F1N2_9TRYP